MSRYSILISFLFFLSCNREQHELIEIKKLTTYPSASGIEYYKNRLYVIGDDATRLLVLDTNFNMIDSITLYDTPLARIPKNIKPDLEAMAIFGSWRAKQLLLIGSGSLSPYRNTAWLVDPETRQKKQFRLDSFYTHLKRQGLREINVEGACAIPGGLLLSNRGHKAYAVNYLLLTKKIGDSLSSDVTRIRIGTNKDTSVFNGVSGLTYAPMSDQLIITVSTEDTRSTTSDGAIGKSYLWIVKNISVKKEWTAINPNEIIDLEAVDPRFRGHKIESACVTRETKEYLYLVLVSDNDDGTSTIFRMKLVKR